MDCANITTAASLAERAAAAVVIVVVIAVTAIWPTIVIVSRCEQNN